MRIAVVGPTACGKSDLGIALALAIDGDVINADAFQLYRGMDIGTAKVPAAQRLGVVHHLLDVLDIDQDASVAAYQRDANAVVDAVKSAGREPILVGGSGLYVRAVVDQLEFPGTDPHLRTRLEEQAAELGDDALHARLATLDPAAAAGILPSNRRRIVRALEVIELTGRPFSATMPDYSRSRVCQIGLDVPDSGLLDEIVARRVRRMVEQGFVDEVAELADAGLAATRTASRAIGYRQLLDHLFGILTLEEAVASTILATRQLIRRQRKWFRRDSRIHWLDATATDLVEQALHLIGSA